jgi:molybdopterin synthase catalytic subunit
MHVLGVVGRGTEARATADRLVDRLGDDPVAVVRRTDVDATGDEATTGEESLTTDGSATTTYELGTDGWTATGRDRSLSDLLDDLAPDHDYALVVGFPEADVPTVVVGDAGSDGAGVVAGEVLLEAETAETVDPADVRARLDATEPYETLESLVTEAKRSADAPYSGAIATFTGRVRAKEDPGDEPTEFLEFEKYEGVAAERLADIRTELEDREGVYEVVMHHRTGVVEYGEDIVFVVVLAGHREEAFRTVEDGINRLKDEVPIFKKEVTTDEQFWVHEQS